jgi:hypothetical protein
VGALRSARRSEQLGEDRFESYCANRPSDWSCCANERRTLTEELELERQERLEAQQRVKQLTREHPHLELERELKRITEELEQEGRLRNHRERQCLAEELEAERFARSEDRREVERLQREAQALVEELEELWEERRPTSKGSKGLWGNLFGANNRY